MAVIGIITCEIFELEFAKLLHDDAVVSRITIIEDRCSTKLIKLLESKNVSSLQCLPHLNSFVHEPDMRLEVLVRVLEIGLHRTGKMLTTTIADTIHSMQPRVDALLLGYGMCGGALSNVHSQVDLHVPLFQPMDHDRPVHDCVALSLGGSERYYREQRKTAGTYFLTPGWSQHWRSMHDGCSGMASQSGIERLLSGYERALLVQTPAISSDELYNQGIEFSQMTGLRLEPLVGTMAPLVTAWESAKDAIYAKPVFVAEGRSA